MSESEKTDLQVHLRIVSGDMAPQVVLTRTPEQAERIADLLDGAHKVARGRAFATFTGQWAGTEVSVLSVGLGGPSVSIAVEEAVRAGARTLILIETALAGATERDPIVVTSAARYDGTSAEYFPADLPAVADVPLALTAREMARRAGMEVRLGQVRSFDRLYGVEDDDSRPVDMSAGLLYPLAASLRCRALVIVQPGDLAAFARGLEGDCLESIGRLALDVITGSDR
ncbi:MAG: hypothetical protein KF727_10315 [Microbacteriaceae bacterium]|nr:hypothetical protein [Microbacteriaceae bacterium]